MTFKFPYKILTFDSNGDLLNEFSKIVNYPVKPPSIMVKGKENQSTEYRIIRTRTNFGTSFGVDICVIRKTIFNLIASPKSPNGKEGEYIDLFDVNGNFISNIKLPHFTKRIHVDHELNLFCVVEV